MNTIKKALAGNHSRPLRRPNPVDGCPLTAALAAVGGKWKLIIIYGRSLLPLVEDIRRWGRAHMARVSPLLDAPVSDP